MARSLAVFQYDDDGNVVEQDIRLDERGDLAILTGLEELRERAACRLQLFKGEDIYNRAAGLPLREEILERPFSEGIAASVISAELLRIPEILTVEEIDIEIDDNRHLSYSSGRITSIFGETRIEVG